MVGTWLGEIRSCSSLAVLLDSAWVLLNKIYQPFFTSLYILVHLNHAFGWKLESGPVFFDYSLVPRSINNSTVVYKPWSFIINLFLDLRVINYSNNPGVMHIIQIPYHSNPIILQHNVATQIEQPTRPPQLWPHTLLIRKVRPWPVNT